jgi:predicted amidophosphoribosyltransferase
LAQSFHNKDGHSLNYLTQYQYGIEEKLILSLKEAQCSLKNFDFVAGLMIQEMYLKRVNFERVIWVTPQSKHSVEIVKSINKITGLNKQMIVLRDCDHSSGKAQKFKKIQERKVRDFKFLGDSIDKSKHYIFVDDIVTTGSTANAAWFALDMPDLFEIWSLAYRPRLAPAKNV